MLKKKYQKYYLAIIFAIVLILLPTHPINAFGIESIATNAITTVFGWLLFIMFSAVGQIISLLATGLYQIINMPIYPDGGTAVISESWKIMRDFANMFFIVALIMMAFATIFDVLPGAAKYNARALFGRFLLTALLINFSLVLGVMIIQSTQVLSNTFLISIGDMSSRLGQGLVNSIPIKPADISANQFANALDSTVFGTIITLIFSIVLLFTFAFSLLTAFLFAVIRIPILWALLIVSPIAWIMNIFPAGQGMFKKWWSMFIGWNMFLPIFLFFLYFGLYFLQNQGDVISKIATQTANQPLGGTSFTFQILFFYILSGVFLIGGTIVAMKAAMFSGTGVVQVAGWSRGVAARRLGLTQAGLAARGRLEEIQKEGLPGRLGKLYGGEAGTARDTARFRDIIGGITGGKTGEADRQLIADVGRNKKKFETITDPEQLKARMGSGNKQEQLAIREIMKDRGLLNNDELLKTYKLYGGNESLAGKQFSRTINFDKLSRDDRQKWFGEVKDIETMQKIAGVMADKGDLREATDINRMAGLFNLEGEKIELINKAKKKSFREALKVQMELGLLKNDQTKQPITTEREALIQEIAKLKPEDLLDYTSTLTNRSDSEIREIAAGALNPKKVEALMQKATEAQAEAWKPVVEKIVEKGKADTEEAERKKAQYLAEALKKAGVGGTGGGGTPPPAGPGPATQPPPVGRGTGQYRGPIGFAPPTNPNNTVDLRNKNNP